MTTTSTSPHALASTLDITSVGAMHEILQDVLKTPGDCHLSGKEVERITTPAIQLLIASQKSLEEKGHHLFVHEPSPAFRDACAALGLDSLLAIWSNYVQ